MLNIIDTFDDILELSKRYTGNKEDIVELWKSYIAPYPLVRDMCIEDVVEYDAWEMALPEVHSALTENLEKIKSAHNTFLSVVKKVEKQFMEIYPSNADIDLYFYLGLANGAGWATSIDGRGSILLGCEKIAALDWHTDRVMTGLVAHELGHEIHRSMRGESLDQYYDDVRTRAFWQLYIEGVAMNLEHILLDSDDFHQNQNGWLDFCRKNENSIKKEYLRRINEGESIQDFYGDWCEYEGHSNVGYYLGFIFIEHLLKAFSINDVALLGFKELEKLLIDFLER